MSTQVSGPMFFGGAPGGGGRHGGRGGRGGRGRGGIYKGDRQHLPRCLFCNKKGHVSKDCEQARRQVAMDMAREEMATMRAINQINSPAGHHQQIPRSGGNQQWQQQYHQQYQQAYQYPHQYQVQYHQQQSDYQQFLEWLQQQQQQPAQQQQQPAVEEPAEVRELRAQLEAMRARAERAEELSTLLQRELSRRLDGEAPVGDDDEIKLEG